MSDTYTLIGQTPIHEPDLLRWGEWMETANCHVDSTQVGPFDVSTVFLGVDHQLGDGPPLLFESMIFDAQGELVYQDRSSTWLEAEQMHYRAMAHAQAIAMELRMRESKRENKQ